MSRTLIGQPSQAYETLQGGKYQANSAGELDGVGDHHVGDLVKAGCVDRDIAAQGALAGINALSGDATKFVAGDGTLKKPVGLPAGGTPGQVVTKTMSGADWETPGGGPISSGKITSPVGFLDVVLPTGYDAFLFYLMGVVGTAPDSNGLGYVVSFDGGATFWHDNVNEDSYTNFDSIGVLNVAPQGVPGLPVAPNSVTLTMTILPGNAVSLFALGGVSIDPASTQSGGFVATTCQSAINADATVPPSPARANLLRIFPQGNQDFPPTGTNTFAAGSWALYGIPTPP